jgi:hypothetical protein
MHVYLQTTRYISLLLSERVDRTCVQRSKEASITGHITTCHLGPTGFQRATLFQLWNRQGRRAVLTEMNDGSVNQSSATRVWIPIGAGLFLVALAVSAVAVPELRPLHFLQALIYVAVVILARRNNAFALGAGFTIAVAWNCLEFFGPHLIQTGAVMFWSFLHTGQVQHLETMMVPIGGIGHFILIIACLTALFHQTTDTKKWWKFIAGGVLVLGYFALIVAIARPR